MDDGALLTMRVVGRLGLLAGWFADKDKTSSFTFEQIFHGKVDKSIENEVLWRNLLNADSQNVRKLLYIEDTDYSTPRTSTILKYLPQQLNATAVWIKTLLENRKFYYTVTNFPCRCHYRRLLFVAASTSISVKMSTNFAKDGTSTQIYCVQTQTQFPANVTRWLFNGQKLVPSSHISITPDMLEIKSAHPSNSGTYTCIADVNGDEVTASNYLKVYRKWNSNRGGYGHLHVPPITAATYVKHSRPVTTALVGSNVTLECDRQNYDTVIWSKQGKKFMAGQASFPHFQSFDKGSRLLITGVTKTDNGTYGCKIVSVFDFIYLTVELFVQGAQIYSYS